MTRSMLRRTSTGSRKLRDVSKDASQHLIGRTQQRMGLLDTPEAAEKKMADAEAELSRLKARTPEQRQKDFDTSAERLRKSVDNLSEQLKTKQDATAQKSSLDGDELFGGARIQAASLGGARIYGGPAGNGPIPEAQRDAARESFRRYLMQRSRATRAVALCRHCRTGRSLAWAVVVHGCRTSTAVPALPVSLGAASRPTSRRRTAQREPKGYLMWLPVRSWPTCPVRACGTLATSIGIGRIPL